ncbi:hypothetical protein GCM10029964_074350 [Kibdelosporangium lantanae]
MNRRGFLLGAGALGVAALAGCTSPPTATPGKLTLWYWTRGLSDNVLREALQRFDGFDPANVGHDLKPKLLAVMSGDAYVPDMTMVNDDIAGYFGDADHFVDLNTLGAGKLRGEYLDWKWQAGSTPDGRLLGFPWTPGRPRSTTGTTCSGRPVSRTSRRTSSRPWPRGTTTSGSARN